MESLNCKNIDSTNIVNTISQRRTIHSYKNQVVSEEIILKAIEMGLWAPNHKLTHPIRFFRLGPNGRQQILNLAIKINQEKHKDEFNDIKLEAIKKQFSQCPELLVLGCLRSNDFNQQKEDYATLACAVQNMSLYLWELGIGSKWSTGSVTKHEQLYDILGIRSEEVILEGFLWIGYAEKIPRTPSRPSINEVCKWID